MANWEGSVKSGMFAVLLGAGVTVVAPLLLAHHAPSAIFDMKKPVTLTGAVTRVEWVNPHIVLFMDVKDESGKVDAWKFESNPPKWFSKVGVNRADFAAAIGQEVSVLVVAAIDGSKYGYLEKMTFPNGDVIAVDRADIK